MSKLNQRGAVHLIFLLLLLIGIGAGVYLTTTGQLKIFSKAGGGPIWFTDVNGGALPLNSSNIPQTTSASVKVQLYSTLGEPNPGGVSSPVGVSNPIGGKAYTVAFRYGEDPAKLESAAFLSYIAHPTLINYIIKDSTPGVKFFWADFKDSNGKVERVSAQIEIVTGGGTNTGFGKAAKFNNDTSNNAYAKVTTSKLATGNPFTVEGWMKTDKPSSGTYVRNTKIITYTNPQLPYIASGYIFSIPASVQERSDVAGMFDLGFNALIDKWTDTQNGHLAYISARTTYGTGLSLEPNKWYHFAATSYSEGAHCLVKLYIDGKLVKSDDRFSPDFKSDCQISKSSPQELVFAKSLDSQSGAPYYSGEIDEVRVSNIVRYNTDFTPPTSPFALDANTLALYHFDNNVNDSSSNGNNGQTFGDVSFVDSNIGIPIPTSTPLPTPVPTVIPTSTPRPTPTATPTTTPKPIISDSFNRSNNKSTLGGNWKSLKGTFGISNNQAYISSGCPAPGYAVIEGGSADGTLKVTLANNIQDARIPFRVKDLNNNYFLERDGWGYHLEKTVAGKRIELTSRKRNATFKNDDVVEINLLGSNIRVFINSSPLLAINDSAITGTKYGIGTWCGTKMRFDDFSFTPVTNRPL